MNAQVRARVGRTSAPMPAGTPARKPAGRSALTARSALHQKHQKRQAQKPAVHQKRADISQTSALAQYSMRSASVSSAFRVPALGPQRALQPEERPAVVGMVLERGAEHLFGLRVASGVVQDGAQPVAGREVEGLGLVVAEPVLDLDRLLEHAHGPVDIAFGGQHLALQNRAHDGDQVDRGMPAEGRLVVERATRLLQPLHVEGGAVGLLHAQMGIAAPEVPEPGEERLLGTLPDREHVLPAAEADAAERLVEAAARHQLAVLARGLHRDRALAGHGGREEQHVQVVRRVDGVAQVVAGLLVGVPGVGVGDHRVVPAPDPVVGVGGHVLDVARAGIDWPRWSAHASALPGWVVGSVA